MNFDSNMGKSQDFWEGVTEGQKHASPSPETERRLGNIEKIIQDIPVRFTKIEDSLMLLPRLEQKLDYTNGKVMKNTAWRWYTTGAIAVITALVVPVLFWAIITISKLDARIHDSVREALQAYDITYE